MFDVRYLNSVSRIPLPVSSELASEYPVSRIRAEAALPISRIPYPRRRRYVKRSLFVFSSRPLPSTSSSALFVPFVVQILPHKNTKYRGLPHPSQKISLFFVGAPPRVRSARLN